MEQEKLIRQFNEDVDRIVEEIRELKWNCGRFLQMIYYHHKGSGYEATKQPLCLPKGIS